MVRLSGHGYVGVVVPLAVKKELEALAAQRGTSVAEEVRRAIHLYLTTRKLRALREAGGLRGPLGGRGQPHEGSLQEGEVSVDEG